LAANRFLRRYRRLAPQADASLADATLEWYTAVHCLRALVEVAEWVHAGTVDDRAGHPWLAMGPQMSVHLGTLVGVEIRPM
jgi:hypothetical protein